MSRFKFKWRPLNPQEAVKTANRADTRVRLSQGVAQISLGHFTVVDMPVILWVLALTEERPMRDDLHRFVNRVNAFYGKRK